MIVLVFVDISRSPMGAALAVLPVIVLAAVALPVVALLVDCLAVMDRETGCFTGGVVRTGGRLLITARAVEKTAMHA
jgi:hypothetical protein